MKIFIHFIENVFLSYKSFLISLFVCFADLNSVLKELKKKNDNKTLISELLKNSSNCDDILKLLNNSLKPFELVTVFDMLRHILMRYV